MIKIPRGGGLKLQLIRGFVGSALIKLINIPLTIIVGVLLARNLGPENYGIYAFVLSLVAMLSIPVKAGMPTLLVKEVARNHLGHHWGAIKGILKLSNFVAIIYSLIAVFFVALFIHVQYGGGENARKEALFWALLLLPLFALEGIRTGALRGLRWVVVSQLPEQFVRPLLMLFFLSIFAFLGKKLTAAEVIQISVFTAIVAFLVGSYFLIKALPKEVAEARTHYYPRQWAKSLVPLSIFAGVQMLDAQVSMILLGVLGSNEDVAILSIATTGAGLVLFSLTAVNMSIGPHVARLYAAGEIDKLQRLLSISVRGATALSLSIVLVYIFWGEELISFVFGEEYSGAASLLIILSLAQLVNCGCGSVATVLHMTGNERSTVLGAVIALAANIILGLVLIPYYGAIGAAFSFSASLVIWNIVLAASAKRKTGLICWFS